MVCGIPSSFSVAAFIKDAKCFGKPDLKVIFVKQRTGRIPGCCRTCGIVQPFPVRSITEKQVTMEIFYHGTYRLFGEFSLSFQGTGEGKAKYGHGIYITSSYATAAKYGAKAAKRNGVDSVYVYTVEVPDIKDDNHVFSCRPVNADVIARVEKEIGEPIPDEVKVAGKFFRKYLGNLLTGKRGTVKKMMDKADDAAEDAALELLYGVGVDYLVWPHAQTNPDGITNRAVLCENRINILKIEQVEVNAKNELIPGSGREVIL